MTTQINGTTVNNILYNGSQLERLQLNGITVWERDSGGGGGGGGEIPASGTVLFESTKGGIYNVDIPATADYEIICVGGGGGGSSYIYNHYYGNSWRLASLSASGGTAGYFKGIYTLPRGSLGVVVGNVGGYGSYSKLSKDSSRPSPVASIWGGNGGNSSVGDYVIAYGGGGSSAAITNTNFGWSCSAGTAAQPCYYNPSGLVSVITNKAGGAGLWAKDIVTSGTRTSVSTYANSPANGSGYGTGGQASSSTERDSYNNKYSVNGNSSRFGFVKITKV